jgi:hypothetical protein
MDVQLEKSCLDVKNLERTSIDNSKRTKKFCVIFNIQSPEKEIHNSIAIYQTSTIVIV